MHSLAICGPDVVRAHPDNPTLGPVDLDGVPRWAGLMDGPAPEFDPPAPAHQDAVLVEVAAFSCNYRDRALIARVADGMSPSSWFAIGSEFTGTVVEVGSRVGAIAVGDRVIPDAAWPGTSDRPGGLPTNHASRARLVIPATQLLVVPDHMPVDAAAGFTIGAQTSYSMVRTLALPAGSTVLVTAARSNTSLFAVQAARIAGHRVVATTSADRDLERIVALGADEVVVVDRHVPSFTDHPRLARLAASIGGFDGVIDPFADVHLPKVLPVLAHGGRYVTCGLAGQSSQVTGRAVPNRSTSTLVDVLTTAMLRGNHLIGNCLGSRTDLDRALRDHANGDLRVVVDGVHRDGDAVGFLDRTFNADDRFGQVVYRHDPAGGSAAP